ncbi:hypothetical protein PENTCL1PPCAC_25011, partial [Pristionchus entomophagus]
SISLPDSHWGKCLSKAKMPLIRGMSTRIYRRDHSMVVTKDPKTTGNIHYGRSRLTRFRARVYTFLDHPRYQKNYWFYLPAVLYHILLYLALCVAGLVLEMYDDTWLREFAYYKWGIIDFDVKRHAQILGMVGSVILVAEYLLRVWSCVSNNKYGGSHTETNQAIISMNHRIGRRAYVLEHMNLLELIITVITAFTYFVWVVHPHFRFVVFARAIHWDKSVHAVRLIRKIFTRGYRYIVPCWAFAFILMALHSCAVYQCERYYRMENETIGASDIDDLGDALWFTYVTSMSIGYGDFTPKTALCRTVSIVFGYCSNGLLFSIQTAVSLFLVKHIADEAHARQDKKVQNLAAKVIQAWARFHLARRKSPASDKFTEICCQKLYRAKQKIDQQRRLAGMILPAKRLIKRAKRTSLTRQRSGGGDTSASVTPPPPASLARKRGSLPNHLHGLFSMTVATASVFSNRVESPESMEPLSEDYSVQNTVDERFLRLHNKDRSGVSSLSRCKTTREEFGPLVIMIQFLLFGHFKRRFRNTEFRKPPEKKVQDEQEKLATTVRDVERQFEQLVKQSEERDKERENLERVVERIVGTASHLAEKVRVTEFIVRPPLTEEKGETHCDIRKRKATLAEVGRKESGEQIAKRKNTIM